MAAVESVLVATDKANGRVGEWAGDPLGRLYLNHTAEILNAGEDDAAFPLALETPLGRYLADSQEFNPGTGADLLAAGLGAQGSPPLKPGFPGDYPEQYGSWEEAINSATDAYRLKVRDHGPPQNTDINGTGFSDLDALAEELADINSEAVAGQFGHAAIQAADIDDANQAKQDAFNVLTDYLGYGVGLGGPGASAAATVYNTHLEGALLENWWPTDNSERVFDGTVPEAARGLVAQQSVYIVESAAMSGAVQLPDSLRDPETGALRQPDPDNSDDMNRFAQDLATFIESNDALHRAVDGARRDVLESVSTLDLGQYRGG